MTVPNFSYLTMKNFSQDFKEANIISDITNIITKYNVSPDIIEEFWNALYDDIGDIDEDAWDRRDLENLHDEIESLAAEHAYHCCIHRETP